MLAVFEQEIAKPPPEFEIYAGCKVPQSRPEMAELFAGEFPGPTFYNFMNGNFIALSRDNRDQPIPHPRYMVVMENMFCVFKGKLENISELSKYYGLNKHEDEARLVVEMYKVLRDGAPSPVDQLIKHLTGPFAFILFDATTSTLFFASDEEGKIPLFWGMAEDKSMAISDNSEIVLDICGQATTYFPPGCLYMNNNNGLMSFANPMDKVKVEVGKESNGDPFSVFFYVDLSDRLPTIPIITTTFES